MWTRKGKGVDLMSLRKRLAAALLSGVLALALCVPAAAEELPRHDATLYVGRITGIIRDSEGGVARLTITSEAGGTYYTLLISPATVWVDAAGRKMDGGAELKEGERIYAACDSGSRSDGKDSGDLLTVCAVVRNVAEEADCAFYHVVSDFAPEKDGGWQITVNGGGMYLHVNGDTTLTDYQTGEELALSQIEIGDRLMAWYGPILTAIYPAEASSQYLMRLPEAEGETLAEGAALSLIINGSESELIGRYESGVAMVPAAAVAQTLGLKASYVKGEAGRVVTIESETFAVTLAIDGGAISGTTRIEGAVGATGPLRYGREAYIEEPGVTWAPAELFRMLGQRVTLEGTKLTIGPM